MLRRHQREKRELEAQILAIQIESSKKDKKRKQLEADLVNRQAELEQKHKRELEKFRESFPENILCSLSEDLAKMSLGKQRSRCLKAQRKHERKVAREREHQKFAEARKEHLIRQQDEVKKINAILEARNLEVKDVPADGHCMYRAIQDQLEPSMTVESLRAHTADYLRKHVDDFLPFISDPETGSPYTHDDFFRYCDDIVYSTLWGGQVELRALSHILQTPIEVIQADTPIIVMGEEYTQKPITIVYTRYAYDLGEHYNSVKPLEAGAVGGAVGDAVQGSPPHLS